MKRISTAVLTVLALVAATPKVAAQEVIGFEEEVPAAFTSAQKKSLSVSDKYYKEGANSLEWSFAPGAMLDVALETPVTLNDKTEKAYGITLWIYNEKPQTDSLRFEFLDAAGKVNYSFGYRLQSAGWRACWMGFRKMQKGEGKEIASYRIVAPARKGSVWIDRLKFPEKNMNQRTTPDMQTPFNSLAEGRDLWHWCRVWEWEMYQCDIPRPTTVTAEQKKALKLMEERLDEMCAAPGNVDAMVKKARNTLTKANIYPSGTGFTGAPILAPDELKRNKGELSWNDLEAMLSGLAYEALVKKSYEAENDYFLVWEYAINQGFAYGSGMGTNHHYGYQTRKIYTTAWLMRRSIQKSKHAKAILDALRFWSALQETRRPCPMVRDEMLDSWNTLLQPKYISAMMMTDDADRIQALHSLTRWVNGSLSPTPGTIGGLKVDGTTFHHGGFYPAYTTGALATVADYVALTTGTEFLPSLEARNYLASGFKAMARYTNKHEWNTAFGGRHPFGGKMGSADIQAFAQIAAAGSLDGKGEIDREMAGEYLRLIGSKNTPEARLFKEKGIEATKAPQGFFVFNYGAGGIHRRDNWMVTLKGYNTNVWGSEIYLRDNRYGRYTSYGSLQIMSKNGGRKACGYVQEGWDWNRLPGTTTIHLPLDLLENPRKGTLMARSPEEFAGTSSIGGTNGMFAMKLAEAKYENFTPDFVARKSAFCFDNRMICLGSGITNGNAQYPTETTLFQSEYRAGKAFINMMGKDIDRPQFGAKLAGNANCWIRDGYGNYYQVLEGLVRVQVETQQSRDDKKKELNQGIFSSAFLIHGAAPKDATYAYQVLIQPTEAEVTAAKQKQGFSILKRDNTAHIVADEATGITGYAAFDATVLTDDEVVATIDAETMVMRHTEADGTLRMSVCDPNLHINEKTYTTSEPSAPFVKTITLKGAWQLAAPHDKVQASVSADATTLKVTCQHGLPIEFLLKK